MSIDHGQERQHDITQSSLGIQNEIYTILPAWKKVSDNYLNIQRRHF